MEKLMSVLVGRPAPDFTAAAVLGSGEIVDILKQMVDEIVANCKQA